jgi:hypothetical protein
MEKESPVTDDELRNWEEWDDDLDCILFDHFSGANVRHWPDVYREGIRVWNVMFQLEMEDESPQSGVLSAIAVQSANGVFESFGAALGVNPEILKHVLHKYYELDKRPRPMGLERFKKAIEKESRDPFWARVLNKQKGAG